MSFPDSVKQEACRKAHFMCVACHAPFVEVHHIIPESEGGPDTLKNTAPLCAGCHSIYGGNPVFRKQIRQMRDNWYDVCERRFAPSDFQVFQNISKLYETLQTVRADQLKYQTTLDQIKSAIVGSLGGTADAVYKAQTFEEVLTSSQGTFIRNLPTITASIYISGKVTTITTMEFLIDTAAEHTCIMPHGACRLGIEYRKTSEGLEEPFLNNEKLERIPIAGIGGSTIAYKLENVSLVFETTDLRHSKYRAEFVDYILIMNDPSHQIPNILGWDVLRLFRLDIWFKGNHISFK